MGNLHCCSDLEICPVCRKRILVESVLHKAAQKHLAHENEYESAIGLAVVAGGSVVVV